MKLTKNLGMLLLGIWLILTGLMLPIQEMDFIMSLIAIVADVLILPGPSLKRISVIKKE